MDSPFLDNLDDLGRRISEVRDEMAAANAIWVLQHIHKTAGTSLVAEIRATGVRYINLSMPRESYTAHDGYSEDAFNDMVLANEARIMLPKLHVATGHYMRRHLDTIAAMRPIRLFTFVRDPVARVFSHYRYQVSPKHPPSALFKAKFPTLADYVHAPEAQNWMAKAICGQAGTDDIDAALARFEFIGSVEQYALSFRLMTAFIDRPRLPAVHANKTEVTDDNDIVLTPALRDDILRLNAVDRYVHDKVTAALRRLEPRIMALEVTPEVSS